MAVFTVRRQDNDDEVWSGEARDALDAIVRARENAELARVDLYATAARPVSRDADNGFDGNGDD